MAADVTQVAPGIIEGKTLLMNILKVLKQKEDELQICKQQLNKALHDKKIAESNAGSSQITKKSLVHTKSDPIAERSICVESRRISAPEIFLFPDTGNKKTAAQMEENIPGNDNRQVGTGHMEIKSPWSLPPTFERRGGSSGVCEQNFHSVLMELVKTKKALKILQMNQIIFERGKTENSKVEQEVQQLRCQNQSLQQEIDRLKQLSLEKSKDRKAPKNVLKDDSFDLDEFRRTTVYTQTEGSTLHTQMFADEREKTYHAEEVEKMREENSTLHKDYDSLMKSYNDLKGSVKILNTCLQEEKTRNKKLGDELERKTSESTKLSVQLGSSRQRYEELLEEKTALEKAKALDDTHSGGTFFSNFSHGSDRFSSTHVRSGDRMSFNIQPTHGIKSGSGSYVNMPSAMQQNNLSGQLSSERAPSNLEINVEGAIGAVADTEDHQSFSCPTCLQEFSLESSYFLHLNKCIE